MHFADNAFSRYSNQAATSSYPEQELQSSSRKSEELEWRLGLEV